jgi:hypothetical protein
MKKTFLSAAIGFAALAGAILALVSEAFAGGGNWRHDQRGMYAEPKQNTPRACIGFGAFHLVAEQSAKSPVANFIERF